MEKGEWIGWVEGWRCFDACGFRSGFRGGEMGVLTVDGSSIKTILLLALVLNCKSRRFSLQGIQNVEGG